MEVPLAMGVFQSEYIKRMFLQKWVSFNDNIQWISFRNMSFMKNKQRNVPLAMGVFQEESIVVPLAIDVFQGENGIVHLSMGVF